MNRTLVFALCSLLIADTAQADEFKPKKASDLELVACLDDANAELRIECIEQFSRRQLVDQQDVLVVVVKDDAEARVRLAALQALRDMEASSLAKAAEHMVLNDEVTSNRAHALGVIEKDCGDESAGVVVKAMGDADATIARKAVIIVGKRGFIEGESWLVEKGITHSEPAVVEQAWKTLTRLGNPDLRPQLHEAMATGNESVRKAIVRAMRDMVLPLDRDPLIAALDDPNTHVARDAAKALVVLGDASVAPILREKASAAADESVRGDFEKSAAKLEAE